MSPPIKRGCPAPERLKRGTHKKKQARHSTEFKEQALAQTSARGARTIESVADELNLSVFPLKDWLRTDPKHSTASIRSRPALLLEQRRQVCRHQTFIALCLGWGAGSQAKPAAASSSSAAMAAMTRA